MAELKEPSMKTLNEKKEQILSRIYEHNLRPWSVSDGNIFMVSDTYPGVWLEHTYDAIAWASYMPGEQAISRNQVKLFMDLQKEDGQLPKHICKNDTGYASLQECVSFTTLAYEACLQNPDDIAFLEQCYDSCVKWDNWLTKYRMPHNKGLIEMFCGFDTGHDNSGRLWGLNYPCDYSDDARKFPPDDPILPILAPDMNAVFYGDRIGLSKLAAKLGKHKEAIEWQKKADAVKAALFENCYDFEDEFFYDVDRNGNKRKVKSCYITNLLSEGVVDFELGNRIFERHLHNPKEFWTPYPFPSVAIDDPVWIKKYSGNSWGYYSQGLTALRSLRWMEKYGRTAEMEEIMRRWVSAWCASETTMFGQELHPLTGEPSDCSQWYSSCMIYFLIAIRRLYGV